MNLNIIRWKNIIIYEDNEENNNQLQKEENTSRNNETNQTNNLIVEKNNSMHTSIESKSTQTKDISDLNINNQKKSFIYKGYKYVSYNNNRNYPNRLTYNYNTKKIL